MAGSLRRWVRLRFPVLETAERHLSAYPVPKNLNVWYCFGILALVVLVNQLLTGLWLAMAYNPSAEGAFASIESFTRDVDDGWLLRYLHVTGASAFFIVIYLHMFRGLLYGSYRRPRELIWLLGMALYLCLMAEGFLGCLLPWGNMSYWSAQVILNLVGSLPVVGDALATWVRGDYAVSGITLNRFFALHVIALPFLLGVLVFLHLVALHHLGSSSPDGRDTTLVRGAGIPPGSVPFHPYYTVHDLVAVVVFLAVFATVVFFFPDGGGHILEPANFEPANPLATPAHITPAWYYTPFYAMLRAVPSKLGGIVTLGAAIAVLFILPWLDRSPVRSIRQKGRQSRFWLMLFAVSFLGLGCLGSMPVTPVRALCAQCLTVTYFLFFLLMPFYSARETLPAKVPPVEASR